LRDKVYGEIVPRLSLAVAAQLPRHGVQMDRDGLNRAYQITLRIFFRMLFQAYADDRKLLPYGENDDYTKNAIKSFAKKLISDDGLVFDDESTSYWDDLIQVWRAIDTGSRRFGIPAYNGGLFSSDEELQPEGALIERLRLTDDVIGPVLRALLIDTADDGTVGPIDFRSLSVREFGTIYEGLLESNLGLADTDLVLDGDDTWIPAPKGAKLEPGRSAKKGTVYFHDTSGARKGTGSYFTPSFVVEHLLERSLDPALDMHLERVKAVLESGNQVGAADLFFDFKVADLAMGSAHFLTAAIDHIEQRMAGFLDAHPIPGITNELRRLEEAAKEKLGENATVPEPSSLLRRQIARRCIYGLDINPVAVELARVSIWIHTFVRGLPMSSLDHTLVCANSLTGIGTVDEALSVLVPERKGNQLTIFDDPIRSALTKAQEILTEVAKAAELDSKESKAASRATQKARKDAEEAKLLFDAAVLTRIGRGDIVAGTEPSEIAQLAADSQAQAALAPLQPAHMPLLFPEVFLRERGGFDVLIGNPPWDMVHVEEDVWWGRHIPGVRGLPVKEMNAAIERYRRDRPDLQEQFDRDRRESDLIREVLLAGPYPGTGSGHLDLYQVFAWRNYQCSSTSGRFGLVLPRVALSGSGSKLWRKELLSTGSLEVVFVVNNRKWVFQEVHAQYSMVFASGVRESDFHGISMSGPFFSLEEFASGRSQFVSLDYETILSGSPSFVVPVLSSSMSASVYTRMRMAPPLSGHPEFEFRPVQGDLNAASDKDRYQKGGSIDGASLPVLAGASFNLWNPRFGPIYGAADKKDFLAWLLEKSKRASKNPRSAHFGETYETAADLPIAASRICYRGVSNATDTRTIIAALIPPHSAMTHGSPYLKRVRGSESDEAYLLGVMCSIPFDWYMRKWVELNVTFELLQPSPIPTGMSAPKLRDSVVRIAGRLAAVDMRFAKWASAVGVEVDSVSDGERAGLEAELDALVAHLYGLTRDQVEHIFKTFHRGWVYAPRLAQVLAHFDSITRTNS
jgi:hypothetical protein